MGYDVSIISFFDIIGFKDLVKNTKNPDEILGLLEAFNRHSMPYNEAPPINPVKIKIFSDSAIRIINIYSEGNKINPAGAVFYELLYLMHTQANLVNKGLFIRGSVTIGEIYFKDNFVFGPGFIKAYELERDISIHPRIIVDPVIFSFLEKLPILRADGNSFEMEKNDISGILSQETDGIWYIDYLRKFKSECGDLSEYLGFLKSHKDLIVKNVRKLKNFNKAMHKYYWLVKYHNDIVSIMDNRLLKESGYTKSKLRINEKILVPRRWY